MNLLVDVLPNSSCQRFKTRLYRWAGATVGEGVEIFQGVKVQGIGDLEIGDRAFIGHEVLMLLNQGSRIVVEQEAIVGSRSVIVTGFHPVTPDGPRILSRQGTTSQVRICRGASVNTACNVLPGVTVGEMSIVAAGATVTHDVPAYTLAGGCPARVIKPLRDHDKE